MDLTLIACILITVSAICGAMIELGLRPEMGHFPCAGRLMRLVIALYALSLFNRAANLGVSIYHDRPIPISVDQAIDELMRSLCHASLLGFLMRSKLPKGVWPWLERRRKRWQDLSNQPHGAAVATIAAAEGSVAVPPDGPVQDLLP